MKTSGLSSASSLPNAQLVECLCQSSWDLNDPSFAAVAGMAMTAMSSGDMDPAALFDKIEVMLHHSGSRAPAWPPAAPRAPWSLLAAPEKGAARSYASQSAASAARDTPCGTRPPRPRPDQEQSWLALGGAYEACTSRACATEPCASHVQASHGQRQQPVQPHVQGRHPSLHLRRYRDGYRSLHAGGPLAGATPRLSPSPPPPPHPGLPCGCGPRLPYPLAPPPCFAHPRLGSPAAQEVAAIAGMADTAQEVECLCAFDLTSMLHDLKPLLLQAMALSKQAAAASQQPALLGQDGHGQYQPALLGQGGHGQYQGQGQGPGIGRRLQGLPSSKADVAALDTELGSPLRTMLADEQSAVGGMFDSQSAMLGGIAAMYIVKKATSPGGMCPSMCTAGSGGAPPASNCDVPLHGKGGGGEGSPPPPSDKAGKGGKGEALSSSLLSIEAKKAEYSKSQALGTSACPGGGGGGGGATAAAVIFALLFVASSTAAFYFYRKAELGGRAKTAQTAISNAQAGSEATIWRIDPLSPAQGADNLRPPQQM